MTCAPVAVIIPSNVTINRPLILRDFVSTSFRNICPPCATSIGTVLPSDGNTTPMMVARDGQIFMNEAFLKYLTAPTITSGGNPPAFSLTPDGALSARNADISGNINANSGTLNNVHILGNCQVDAVLSANQIRGDIAKIVACNRGSSVYIPAEEFDRTLAIPSVWVTAWGFSKDSFHVNITVTVNAGGRVYTGTTYATNRKTGICDVFCTIPANTPAKVVDV
ncbi:hypothetical protein GKU49_22970 [Salmonella enterica]|nr:hypothetical protein [Salmonella enterica]EBW3901460.1 hypothetical protein [Salmonella enterica subsp. enterica serovar Panama]EDB3638181.1 hypothetical protein [Salmonella enterica subsp. enterica serovar Oranienburg]EDQ4202158.1 hypothetical protein [Salmonella enterica subsp. enterica serovar Glostrup]EBW6121947.1 hypothetical protein [Salmonella enterica subsp. enterica serovar Panama]